MKPEEIELDADPVPNKPLGLNKTARIPFEDMDCVMTYGPVPYPYKGKLVY